MGTCKFCNKILKYKRSYSVGTCINHNNEINFFHYLDLIQFDTEKYMVNCYLDETYLIPKSDKPTIVLDFPMTITPDSLNSAIEKILKLNAFS